MERDVVASIRKAKIPISLTIYRVFRDRCRNHSIFCNALSQKKI